MRFMCGVILVGMLAPAQSLVEHAAAAAGGSVGGVAGKKISDGLNSVFGKVEKQTDQAAKTDRSSRASKVAESATDAPLFEVGPGVPKGSKASVPPPPPPLKKVAPRKPLPVARSVQIPMPAPQLEAPPQPNPITATELRAVKQGMPRSEVLRLGPPAARITMYDDGHLLEIFRYQDADASLGVVRLTDGAVSSVQIR